MSVIGTLTVNLEANTAKFSGDLGKASNDAKKFGHDAEDAGGKAEYSMGEARHGVMLLGEEFGIRMPRAVSGFIASIGPVGAAMEAAFPFLAIVAGATILIEHFSKIDEEAKKAAEASEKAFSSATKSLQEATAKSLELQIQLGELSGGPVTELKKKLADVNALLAGMRVNPEIKSEFEELTKAIDIHTPSGLNPLHWFDGVKVASEQVKAETQAAAKAITEATTLEEKQATAVRELTAARLRMATIQTYGNAQNVADQQKLIDLLDITQQKFAQDVSAQENSKKVTAKKEEIAQEKKMAEERKKIDADRRKESENLLSTEIHSEALYTAALKKEANQQNEVLRNLASATIKSQERGIEEKRKLRERETKEALKETEKAAKLELHEQEMKNRRILAAESRFNDAMARSLTGAIAGQQSFAGAMRDIGAQLAEGIMENSIKAILANDMTKPSDAKAAARKAYLAGTHFPWPMDIVMPPVLAGAAFAAVMAFEGGGEIPGSGAIPIIGHGGETVVTRALTEQVKNSTNGGSQRHNITYSPVIHAMDAHGVERVLEKHAIVFERHITARLRRMNKG
jgi:hypothetical protein